MKRDRRSKRLPDYDYSQVGAYYVTICTQGQKCFFMDPHPVQIADDTWLELPGRFPNIGLDEFVIMPNHIHFILWLNPPEGRGVINCAPTDNEMSRSGTTHSPIGQSIRIDYERPTLGQVVRTFKSLITRRIRAKAMQDFAWQRNYFEHVIRSERALKAIRQYISDNPTRWHIDRYNPDAIGTDPTATALWSLVEKEQTENMEFPNWSSLSKGIKEQQVTDK
jgi:putative transposase